MKGDKGEQMAAKLTLCAYAGAFILGGLLTLTQGCDKPEEHVQKHEKVDVAPPPPPVNTNPFEKPPPVPPGSIHEPVQNSRWEQVGGEFKMNDNWSLWTWRDGANHNTCYFYNVMSGEDHKVVIGHGMSCVKE